VIWVRGEIVADDALRVSVLDRTFEHGLGLFETFRTWNGHATLLPRHLDRLRASARALGLPPRLRITLSGGLSSEAGETLWMRSFPMAPSSFEEGIILGPAWAARADALAGHKTLNYWFNRLMFEDAQARGFDECVTITPDGNVWEGSRSNLFAVVDGDVLTPPGDGKVLPGIMRGLILERGPRLGFSVREATLGIMDPLFRPQEVFLTNSVRGVVPVRQWGDARFPAPGPITRRLWEAIRPWLESGGQTT
jgi:branched-subunit amino acid aminotransferase/4-amino-4-deoxychorismate lyase